MSNASRITYLAPLLALTLGTACDTDQDDQVDAELTEQTDDDTFRTGKSRWGSGDVLNTNNLGGHLVGELFLGTGSHDGVELIGVVTGPFDPMTANYWEHDDVSAGLQVDNGGGVMVMEVDANHMLTGTTFDGTFLQHSDFNNSVWTVQVDPGLIPLLDMNLVDHDGSGVVELRLEVSWMHPDGVAPVVPAMFEDADESQIAADGSIPIYTFFYSQDGEAVSTCTHPSVPGPTSVAAVLYNDVVTDMGSGDVTHEDDMLTIGCLEGAIGKAGGLWGYWPNEVDDESTLTAGAARENFDTATRAVRADYCGDGTSWTISGTELELYDVYAHTVPDSVASDIGPTRPVVEAVWGPGGAVCLDTQRYLGRGMPACGIPLCGGKYPSFGMLNDPSHPSTILTRTVRVWEANI